MRISDWSSDVCSSDLGQVDAFLGGCGIEPVGEAPGEARRRLDRQNEEAGTGRGAALVEGRRVLRPVGTGEAGRQQLHHQRDVGAARAARSEEHTSELQSLMRISYAVFFLKKTK